MKKFLKALTIVLLALTTTNCGPSFYLYELPPVGSPDPVDDSVIVGRAVLTIEDGKIVSFSRYKPVNLLELILPKAIAYNGSTPPTATVSISYTNAASSNFSLDSGAINVSPIMSPDGLTLDFGTISINGLDDNALKKCGSIGTDAGSGSTKCNTAAIRVYASSGDANGVFCNTAESYCVPMKVNNATFGVGLANAQTVITHSIPNGTNRLRASHFAQTSWSLTADLSNAGEGSYSSTVIVEYVLKKL